ncbi:MAG TPA: DUF4143 domain-containing protein [Gemmatimonadales bacterium]|nr:DUF4143 domain-containing protein [Gemmatimonadales bacterium]
MEPYIRRVIDTELDALLPQLPAVALEGPRGVGKTATAERRVRTVFRLDTPDHRALAGADPTVLLAHPGGVLLDEWQHVPAVWDAVRRAVDDGAGPGSYLLAGSAVPQNLPTHSGAGRIPTLRMRPLALSERGLTTPTVSLGELIQGRRPAIQGTTTIRLADYVEEILASGLPGIRRFTGRARRLQLDSYLARLVDRDFEEQGHPVRRPALLQRWIAAYAAASATTATFEAIRAAATSGDGVTPTRPSVLAYRAVLERLWILDPVPGWRPSRNHLGRLTESPKHHLADPALAARLVGVDEQALLGTAPQPTSVRDGTLLGQLFESLVTLSVRVYAQAAEATVRHLRTYNGRHEVDLIVETGAHRVLAVETKLSGTVNDDDVQHLRWLQNELGDELLDAVVVTTGSHAYRRPDGVAVVPAALLGP